MYNEVIVRAGLLPRSTGCGYDSGGQTDQGIHKTEMFSDSSCTIRTIIPLESREKTDV